MISTLLSRIEAVQNRALVKRLAGVAFQAFHSVLVRVPWGKRCPICGALQILLYRPVVGKQLAEEMRISETWCASFNHRDGTICLSCGGALRVSQIASLFLEALSNEGAGQHQSLYAAVNQGACKTLAIAEINACGSLHDYLARIETLCYSEYGSDQEGVPHEDFLHLSYPDNHFDYVFHSDTLEHVPDVEKALLELYRVLKPGGKSIFTVPLVRDGRPTIKRAEIRDGQLVHLLPPSFHGGSYQSTNQYLVFYEFGADFLELIDKVGFEKRVLEYEGNPAAVTFLAKKPAMETPVSSMG